MIFVSACATAFTGFTEKTIFGLSLGLYNHYDAEFLIPNFTGYVIFIFATLVVYLTVNPRFKRPNETMVSENTSFPQKQTSRGPSQDNPKPSQAELEPSWNVPSRAGWP